MPMMCADLERSSAGLAVINLKHRSDTSDPLRDLRRDYVCSIMPWCKAGCIQPDVQRRIFNRSLPINLF